MTREAVIVSTARTGLAKSGRGGFNITHGAAIAGHAVKHSIERANLDPAEIDDVIMGCGTPEGATGQNVGRLDAIWAGCPVTTSGVTVNRFCSSGLQTIAMAAGRVVAEGADAVVGAGVETISMVSMQGINLKDITEEKLMESYPALWMPMIETADIVAKRYDISRESQDEYSLQSQQRTAAAQTEGKFKDEIVPLATKMDVMNKETKEVSEQEVTVDKDECNRPQTTIESLAGLQPVMGPDKYITAGNASQLSDGASSCLLMDAKEAEKRNIEPMGIFRGLSVAACEPDEMGIGPVFAVPKLLEQHGLKVDDIDLWELNEAFACQALAVIQEAGLDPSTVNVNGGAIALGHPLGCTGAKLTIQLLNEMKRRDQKYGMVTACVGGGQGIAGIFERL